MAKTGSKEKPIVLNAANLEKGIDAIAELLTDDRDVIIKGGQIHDGKLNYSFEKLKAPGKGTKEKAIGPDIVHSDLMEAFKRLNVHLAVIDDAFKSKMKKKDTRLEDLAADHEVVELYDVSGFEIKGKEEDEKVILIGTKYVSLGGRMDIKSIPVNMGLTTYKFYNELKADMDFVRMEVEEYRNGKCTPVLEDDIDPSQTRMQFEQPEGAAADLHDDELKAAKVE